MIDIVLTHGYFLSEDEKEKKIMRPYPPLGLMYISAYLKKNGFTVLPWDATFQTFSDFKNLLNSKESSVLGIYSTHMTRIHVVKMIRMAHESGWTVILGGPDPANYPSEYLDAGADIIVKGEGEDTLCQLLPKIKTSGLSQYENIKGIIYKTDNNRIVTNPPADFLNIDSIPWPDRESWPVDQYIEAWSSHHHETSLNMITARGCPYRCNWCSHAVFGSSFRKRNFLDCAAELAYVHNRFKPDQVWYSDDVFTMDIQWLYNYAAQLDKMKLKIPFETISRADRLLDAQVMKTLREMECKRLWIGSESGSDRILKSMERGVTSSQIVQAVQQAKSHGIETGIFLIWGYPGESFQDIKLTVDHIRRAQPDILLTTMIHPIKNTRYFDSFQDKLVLSKPWEISSEKDYLIPDLKPSAYYSLVNRWIKKTVKAYKAEPSDPEKSIQYQAEADQAEQELRNWTDE